MFKIRGGVREDIEQVKMLVDTCLCEGNKYRYENNIFYPSDTVNSVAINIVDNRIVGYITALRPPGDPRSEVIWKRLRPYIGFVGVLPEARYNGIATTLLKSVSNSMARHYPGSNFIYLECKEKLVSFYERRGYSLVDPNLVKEEFGVLPKGPLLRTCIRPRNSAAASQVGFY